MAEKSEHAKFLAAAAKLRRDIAEHAKGGEHDETLKLYRATDRLEDRIRKIDGDREALYEIAKVLRQSIRLAEDAAYVARVEWRNNEIKRLNQQIRESQPQGYEKELAISRGGAYRREPDLSPAENKIVEAIEGFFKG